MNNKKLILPIVVGLILVIFLIWYFGFYKKSGIPIPSTGGAPTGPGGVSSPVNSQSLGGELYGNAQNPIGDKVPSTNPVPNPIEGIYKNPFAE